ncbi:DUF4258 domain-containing protein [Cyanobacterium sp. Dongsha4]|uniref:DUF4258 domain-containing protein n=1 Tax=Cyanobacterium sp. DS4 TaxID=2878255 RepID=UPI002E80C962|nr:DUF4258 domain-containing protein [Cyanobacterium sp. Dongsha4]WVL00117.1 DUF4258 domain-containing protein [Cyanobacterium sp. Dongsha4]
MKSIDEIRLQLRAGQFQFTRHGLRRLVERNISRSEIIETGENAIIIEDYPDDKYSPSCLVLGITINQRFLHLQVSRKDADILTIITLYEPDPQDWINYSQRR